MVEGCRMLSTSVIYLNFYIKTLNLLFMLNFSEHCRLFGTIICRFCMHKLSRCRIITIVH